MSNDITYMVYTWRGEIKVKEGIMRGNGVFFPPNANSPWMSKCPTEPMKINSRAKVWCIDESQIPRAKEMLIEYARRRIETIEGNYNSAIRNVNKIINAEDINDDKNHTNVEANSGATKCITG